MSWNGKLGRHTLGFYRKDKVDLGHGYIKIVAKFDGRCTVCKEDYSEGMKIGYNKDRMPGCKTAHVSCVLRLDKESGQ